MVSSTERSQKRTRHINFYLSDEEVNALDRLREREGGLTKSAMIRRLIRIEAKSKSLWAVDDRMSKVVAAKAALFG